MVSERQLATSALKMKRRAARIPDEVSEKALTGAPEITPKLPLLENHLVIRLGNVGQIVVWFRDEKGRFWRIDLSELFSI